LLEELKIRNEQIYNREVVREDLLSLADLYSDNGYAYADISPRINKDMESHRADITYMIDKGPLVYFERIVITGNTKTRDKVIRRQLKVYEQELFSGQRLKRGTRDLYRLDYFEDIKVNTTQGSAKDKMILNIDVTEKPTGAFSFGGGYSSVDKLFAMASISQRNLFGRGQTLNLRAQLGNRTSAYTFSFTEPWLFDIPLSAGIDLYNTNTDYDTYDKDSFGGTLRFGYPFWDYTKIFFSYNYDDADIKNLTPNASSAIREFVGNNVTHTLSATLQRDTRDRIFNPTEGSNNAVYVEHAGTPFGGDVGFTKYTGDSKWYIPLFWDTVGAIRGRIGFIHGDSVGKVPTWERFYLGGMGSVRGYDWRDISPRDPDTGDEIGGNKMMQFNLEFLFPLIKKSGLRGVLFADAGNAFDNGEELRFGELRQSIGYGFRWYSPVGPIRLEYGYILDDKEDQQGEGGWEFSMGMAF
jgi:outer membrane protein insertion porin family